MGCHKIINSVNGTNTESQPRKHYSETSVTKFSKIGLHNLVNSNIKVATKISAHSVKPLMTTLEMKPTKSPITKYKIAIKYSPRQVINPRECFFIKNTSRKNIDTKNDIQHRKIKLQSILDRINQKNFNAQMKETKNIDLVFNEFVKQTSEYLNSVCVTEGK